MTEISFFKRFLAKWRKFVTEKYLQRNEGWKKVKVKKWVYLVGQKVDSRPTKWGRVRWFVARGFPGSPGSPQQEAGRRKGELQRHRGFRASLTLSLFARARSFRQQSCRFWTPILLHSSPPARVLASPGKFRFYFASFAVISSLFNRSWYCLIRPACSAGKF